MTGPNEYLPFPWQTYSGRAESQINLWRCEILIFHPLKNPIDALNKFANFSLFAFGFALCGSTTKGDETPKPVTRPNIVFIVADDLGYGDLSCYGNTKVETPHIDQLAKEGVRFTDFHVNAPVCSPSRAAFFTGRYQQRVGVYTVFRGKMKRSEILISQRLKGAGYATAIFGKWHISGHARTAAEFNAYAVDVPTTWGFDEYVGKMGGMIDAVSHYSETGHHDWWHGDRQVKEEGYSTRLLSQYATEFIDRHAGSPFRSDSLIGSRRRVSHRGWF